MRIKRLLLILCLSSQYALATPEHIYLSRHMEKQPTGQDPQLTSCGLAQAAALAKLLQQYRLTGVYHTPYQRTRQTAQALAVNEDRLHSYNPADLSAFSQQLLQQQGILVVIGHSNTTPVLASLISKQQVPALDEQHYGRVYHLSRHNDSWQLDTLELPLPDECSSTNAAQQH